MSSAKPVYSAEASDTMNEKGLVNDGVREYYQRVAGEVDQGFEDDDEKHVFLTNVFNQLTTEAVEVCMCRNLSPIIESLVRIASPEHLISLFEVFQKDWSKVCTDRFASFVAQTLILQAHKCLQAASINDEHREKIKFSLSELFEHLMDDFDKYIDDVSASHILRIFIQIYTCVAAKDLKENKWREQEKKKFSTQDYISTGDKLCSENLERIKAMAEKMLEHPKFTEYLTEGVPSVVIQTLLIVLSKRDISLCNRFCDAILPDVFDNKNLATDPVGSRMVEQLLVVAPDSYFEKLFEKIVNEMLEDWACHPSANFIIQKLILNLRSVDQFKTIFDKIIECLESVLASKCYVVVINLAKAALKYGTRQEKLIKAIMKAFHCYKPETRRIKVVPLVASLSAYEFFFDVKTSESGASSNDEESNAGELEGKQATLKNIELHGSLLLQTLLDFGQPSLVVTSLLELTKSELLFMVCHQSGSHIVEAFFMSKSIGASSKDALSSKLKGCLVDLVCSKCGSHVFEKIWKRSSATQKNSIAAELVQMQTKVENDRIGAIMWKKYDIRAFTKSGKGSMKVGNKNVNSKTSNQTATKRKSLTDQQEISTNQDHSDLNISPKKKHKQSEVIADDVERLDKGDGISKIKTIEHTKKNDKDNVQNKLVTQANAKKVRADGREWEVRKRPSKRKRKALKLNAGGAK